MAFSLVLATLLLVGATQSANLPGRIVGGEHTSIQDYPSLVAVEFRGVLTGIWSQSCAANVLTSRYVLSAAHCFEGLFYSPSARRIRAGSSIRNNGGQVVDVLREINHPSYGSLEADGDIGLVLLNGFLDLTTPAVKAAILPTQGFKLPDNYPVIHAGWGTTSFQGVSSTTVQHVTIFTVNLELCRERYLHHPTLPRVVSDNMVCAGLLDVGGKDACQGDSGGPLYMRDAEGTLFLHGIVSWGYRCAEATYPGVSTAVSSYIDWIIANAQ